MTALLKVLALLDGLDNDAQAGIQSQLNEIVEKYGHGLVQHIRYLGPGMARSPEGTHFLTLASAKGPEITIEIQLKSKAAAWILDAALDRL